MTAHEPLPVLQVMRRPFAGGKYSIEGLFETVRSAMPPWVHVTVGTAPCVSQGLRNRVTNLRWMRASRAPITHITGDVTYLAAALPRRGSVITIHDVGWTRRGRLNRAAFDLMWLRMPVARAERVTVVSEAVRRDVVEITGCDPAKVEVIPNCVHPDFTPAPGDPARHQPGRPTVLQVGTSANKNIERVAAALAGVDCELHIIGAPSPEQAAALRRYAVRYRVSTDLSRAAVVDAYREAALVVFASTFEGFGLPILEGQAAGRPVVTSAIPPMHDVAGGGACFVDPYEVDAIRGGVLRVLEDPGYRAALLRAGFANAARYSAPAIAERYAALYLAVAGSTASPWAAARGEVGRARGSA